jgi:hypothetical protein
MDDGRTDLSIALAWYRAMDMPLWLSKGEAALGGRSDASHRDNMPRVTEGSGTLHV